MWSYINGLILKKAQNNMSPSKAEINYYPVCFFQNLHVFFIKVGGIVIVMEAPFWEILVFSDLWLTLSRHKSNLRNCILNESK